MPANSWNGLPGSASSMPAARSGAKSMKRATATITIPK